MADTAKSSQGLIIPPELQKKYPELIALIKESESMNDEERQYWINILSVMTPQQIENLKEILVNEKDQLAAIDKKYAKEIEQIGQKQLSHKMEEERKKRRDLRAQKEEKAEAQEEKDTEDLLKKIEKA